MPLWVKTWNGSTYSILGVVVLSVLSLYHISYINRLILQYKHKCCELEIWAYMFTGVVTTPQLHYFVWSHNTKSTHPPTEEGYYLKMAKPFIELTKSKLSSQTQSIPKVSHLYSYQRWIFWPDHDMLGPPLNTIRIYAYKRLHHEMWSLFLKWA